ncbi:MAG: hypothetical protein ACQES9_09145, partial [Myxococcota bacterium]
MRSYFKFLSFVFALSLAAFSVACDDDSSSNNTNNTNNNAECGNGIIEGDEVCDGTNLGENTCADLEGFTGGELACNDSCEFDTSACTDETCTDECSEGNEVCDSDGITLRSCELNQDTGCTEWVDTDCSANGEVCSVVDGDPQCVEECVDDCSLNETQCSGDTVQTCETLGTGC